ncbi:MAG TPA: divergent polysaccharide deacetylase family protein [Candidatus Sulfotelmatobacter sp.]|nr:divergent polysaccharide deacetylase family protein [Candidatus Sulfotelmatobacter sp.]
MKRLLVGVSPGMRLLLLGVGVLGLGIVIGLVVGPHRKPPQAIATAHMPTTEQVAQAPHPAVDMPPDPPATETSHQTVLEDPQAIMPPAPSAAATASAEPPPVQVASLPKDMPPPPKGTPPWKRYALPSPATGGKPMIAVIIDDMGVDKKRSEKILQLPGPLTVSLMSYADDLSRLSDEARRQGDELMMHLPMEPMAESVDPGPGALLTSLSPEEIHKRFVDDLDRFSGYVGINNHMGSKFTAYEPGMTQVMEELRRRGLLFIDSLTTERSVGLDLAHRYGVPTAGRNVFLDNAGDLISVDLQLTRTEEVARKKGNAIAIGHPRDATIQALAAWLPTLEKKGFVLVPVTAVVQARMAEKSVATSSPAGHAKSRGE